MKIYVENPPNYRRKTTERDIHYKIIKYIMFVFGAYKLLCREGEIETEREIERQI